MVTSGSGDIVLSTERLTKSYSGVTVFDNFSFELRKGEIHAVCGENGAGKSTFIKILSGAIQPDYGEMYIEGVQYESLLTLDMNNLTAREHFLPLLTAGGWLCVVLSALLNYLHMRLWQRPRTTLRLHQLLGFLTALAAAMAVYAALLSLNARAIAPAAPVPADLRTLFMPDAEHFWVAVSYAPLASLALAGGYGALWLLLRRTADDYGRDHYNLVIPWCAGWARNAWLLLWLFITGRMGWRIFQLREATGGKLDWNQFAPEALVMAVLLLPGLWWMGVSHSTTPLRAKIATPLAPLWATGCLLLLDMGWR